MPILITGLSNNSPNDKKKQKRDKAGKLLAQSSSEDLLPASQREDRGEDTSQGYLCSMDGIAEIFNMRMYKIPREAPTGRLEKGTTHSGALMKPHVIKTKTILIGASYHVEEDTQTGRRSVRKEALRKPSKPAASEEEAKKLSALALRLQQLKNRGVTDQVHEVAVAEYIFLISVF